MAIAVYWVCYWRPNYPKFLSLRHHCATDYWHLPWNQVKRSNNAPCSIPYVYLQTFVSLEDSAWLSTTPLHMSTSPCLTKKNMLSFFRAKRLSQGSLCFGNWNAVSHPGQLPLKVEHHLTSCIGVRLLHKMLNISAFTLYTSVYTYILYINVAAAVGQGEIPRRLLESSRRKAQRRSAFCVSCTWSSWPFPFVTFKMPSFAASVWMDLLAFSDVNGPSQPSNNILAWY